LQENQSKEVNQMSVEKKRIYLSSPTMHEEEMLFIKEAFDTNWIAPLGKNVDEFEKDLASYIGVKHAAALTSGTAAIHLALKWVGVEQSDIVFCSDLTFAATVNPVAYEQGRQIFIDSEPDTWNMDPKALEKAFEKYPNPKAVIVAHLYGTPARIDEIKAICDAHNTPLIEDAAESLGATYDGIQTGTFGQLSVVSFNGNKIITSSGGGMLLSNDEAAISKARFWATQARDPALHYLHSEIGYNYRMSNIVAGIGRGQMIHLKEHIASKKKIYETYESELENLPFSMNPHLANSEPNYWLSCLLLEESCKITPLQVIRTLAEENIECRPIWFPMHLQPLYKGYEFISAEGNAVSEDVFARGLCLPSDIKMTDEEIHRVIDMIKGLF
jgi:Predicted pyridoxal phosphate-dependent enzyme apparently involved in regulation of cell wall biogenesis